MLVLFNPFSFTWRTCKCACVVWMLMVQPQPGNEQPRVFRLDEDEGIINRSKRLLCVAESLAVPVCVRSCILSQTKLVCYAHLLPVRCNIHHMHYFTIMSNCTH